MMFRNSGAKRFSAIGLLTALALALTGCFMTPGKFTSDLHLMKDGSFSYTYDGEIFFIGMSKLAQMAANEGKEAFEPNPCYNDADFEERPCSEDELAEQKAEWEEAMQRHKQSKDREAQQMAAMMGGIDMSDPAAADELAKRLERQRGWNKVEHVGNGVFNVEFAISGTLDTDFVFPIIEGFPVPSYFVQIILRDDGRVRIEAPGFAASDNDAASAGLPGSGMTGLMAMAAAEEGGDVPEFPQMDGTFTITTDGDILANNTDEGPAATSTSKVLSWKVTQRTKAAPMALIDLKN